MKSVSSEFVLLLFVYVCDLSVAKSTKIVDLTWDFNNETIYWAEATPFHFTEVNSGNSSGFWYAANEFCAAEHGGTHFDAPYHFNKDGWKVAEVPVERLLAKGALLELPDVRNKNLAVSDLEKYEETHGSFDENTILLVKFGWSRFWPNKTEYLGIDSEGKYNFPGLSQEAAAWIANKGKIVGVGVDTASVDPGQSTEGHQILSKNQIFNLENVKMLHELPPKGFTIVALPMKLGDGTGAPLRVLALL